MGGDQDTALLIKIAEDVSVVRERVAAVETSQHHLKTDVSALRTDVGVLKTAAATQAGAAGARAGATDVMRWRIGTLLAVCGTTIGAGWFVVGSHLLG